MMFDGERTHLKSKVLAAGVVYGSDADSGDGNNRDTIKLIPDSELHRDDGAFNNDQYLIIDPTIGDPVGHIHIRAGGSIDSSTADLFLGGEKNNVRVSDTSDRVSITADAGESGIKTWLFDGGGALTFPDTSFQTTAYAPVTGEWTVTTGTSTYSFTLPADGTYTMWVKGNIPNGIIVWNATVSVSNSNVPAIGTQYAWNYTGGGSPILLTAIPDQIKGTAGGISTDNTYVGTTSNRFDFTIANTSGESQTVYYGYTKV
jgi:hypothetical protein